MTYLGIDLHTRNMTICAVSSNGKKMVMGTQRELRELLRARLRMVWRRCKVQDSLYNLFFKYNVPIPKYPFRNLNRLGEHFNNYLPPAASLEACLQIDQLRLLEGQVHRIEKQIDGYGPAFPDYNRISQVPGIGKVSSWSILAEIGDISRFKSDKNFVSYCRLVPGAADSGG